MSIIRMEILMGYMQTYLRKPPLVQAEFGWKTDMQVGG